MGQVVEIRSWGKDDIKPAERLAMMVAADDRSALSYAHGLNESAEGRVSIAAFINRCQRSLDLAAKARNVFFGDAVIGGQVCEAFEYVSKSQAMVTPTVIESRLFSSFKIASNFKEVGRYSRKNPEIQFLYDMKNCPRVEGDVTYYARQVDYAMGRMLADGRFSEQEIIDVAMRCSPLNDSVETLMLPIMLLRDEMMKQDKDFIAARVAEGIDMETAIEICQRQLRHRPGDAEYYDEIREHVRRKECELA